MTEVKNPPREFDCVECGRHIHVLQSSNKKNICGLCITNPGWHRDPVLKEFLDPAGDEGGTTYEISF